jgi:long-chain acyl-CoA synthetase
VYINTKEFKNYFNNHEATQEAIDSDGWFHTGDVGELDAQGFLSITDRKKDIIVLAAGKKVAPQNIENLLKTDRYLSQVVVHGDRRKFLSALVTLNRAEVENFAHENQILYQTFDHLIQNERVYNLIKNSIESKNRELAPYQTIKRFAILPHDFSVESGELTPTLKIRRRVIEKRYGAIFDGFYGEP